MALETKATLEKETIDKLQKLIRSNIDSSEGFRAAADEIQVGEIATLFRRLAAERTDIADELKTYVEWNGEEAVDDGSFSAAVHRAWITVRSLLTAGDAYPILAEAERGEDHIKQAYEEVLKETAGSAMNNVLLRQYASVKSGHDQIRNLRDSFKQNS